MHYPFHVRLSTNFLHYFQHGGHVRRRAIAVIEVIVMNGNNATPAAIAAFAHRSVCVCCCRKLHCRRSELHLLGHRQQQQQHWHAIECCAWQGRVPKQLLL